MKTDLSKDVTPILDSNFADARAFVNAPIYTGDILDEIKKTDVPPCFLGAWYRKVISSKDYWLGIEGVVTLGEFVADEDRFGTDKRIVHERYLDNPSVYMGGQAMSESDAGLGLNSGYFTSRMDNEINYGTPKVAYRPFWRYIYSRVTDVKGNVERFNVNSWNVADPSLLEFYYFPGDKIKMSVYSPLKDYLQLRIEMIEKTKIEKYVQIRKKYNLEKSPRVFYSPLFISEGHRDVKAEFKRVNSIDQYGNEGLSIKKTEARVTKSTWENTYLFREIDGIIQKIAFNEKRQIQMACPNKESFKIEKLGNGGENIEITPTLPYIEGK